MATVHFWGGPLHGQVMAVPVLRPVFLAYEPIPVRWSLTNPLPVTGPLHRTVEYDLMRRASGEPVYMARPTATVVRGDPEARSLPPRPVGPSWCDAQTIRFSEMSAEAEAEMAAWDDILKGRNGQ